MLRKWTFLIIISLHYLGAVGPPKNSTKIAASRSTLRTHPKYSTSHDWVNLDLLHVKFEYSITESYCVFDVDEFLV